MANGYYTVTLTNQQIQARDALAACVPLAGSAVTQRRRTAPADGIQPADLAWQDALPERTIGNAASAVNGLLTAGLSNSNITSKLTHQHTTTFNVTSHISESVTHLGPLPNVATNRARANLGEPGSLSRYNTAGNPHQLLVQWLGQPVCSSLTAAPQSIAPVSFAAESLPAGGLRTRTPAQICADSQSGNNAALQFLVMRNGAWRMGNQGGNPAVAQSSETIIAGQVHQGVSFGPPHTQRFTDRANLESGYIAQIEQDLQARSHQMLLEQNGGRLPTNGQAMPNGITYNPATPAYLMLSDAQQRQVQQNQLQSPFMQTLLLEMDGTHHLLSANPNFSVFPTNSQNNGRNPVFPTTFRPGQYNGVVAVGFLSTTTPAIETNKAPPRPTPMIDFDPNIRPVVPGPSDTGKGAPAPTKVAPASGMTKGIPEDEAVETSRRPTGLSPELAALVIGEGRSLQGTITISGASAHDPSGQFNNGLSGVGGHNPGGHGKFS